MPETLAKVPLTIDALLGAAAIELHARVPDAKREARALWGALAGMAPGNVWLRRHDVAPPVLATRFRDAVQARVDGVPFGYAAGKGSFRGLDLLLDRRALIPRPETEGLVDLALEWGKDGGRAADLGTGSGCIALSMAVEGRFTRVTAVDRSAQALALAAENVARINPRVPVDLHEGSWLDPLRALGERYRVITANPPYLTDAEYAALDVSVRDHEPAEALASGADGLDAIRAILSGAATLLERGGALILEIDERRPAEVARLAAERGWERTLIHEDLFGRTRYAVVLPGEDA